MKGVESMGDVLDLAVVWGPFLLSAGVGALVARKSSEAVKGFPVWIVLAGCFGLGAMLSVAAQLPSFAVTVMCAIALGAGLLTPWLSAQPRASAWLTAPVLMAGAGAAAMLSPQLTPMSFMWIHVILTIPALGYAAWCVSWLAYALRIRAGGGRLTARPGRS